jgi:hypothetical protein
VDGKIVVPALYNGLPVVEIAQSAFGHVYNITNGIFLPDTLEVIGACAFSGIMSPPKTLRIPKSVNTIGKGAFFGSEFEWISVDEENEHFCSLDGNLFTKDKSELIAYAIGKEEEEYYVPDEVMVLRELSFYRANLKRVVFNDGLLEIKWSAFCYSKLEELNLPPFLQSIGEQSFSCVTAIMKTVIPATVNYIGHEAFYGFFKSEIFFEKPIDFLLVYAYKEKKSNKKVSKSALKNPKKATKLLTDKFNLYDWTAIRKYDKKVKEM